MKKILYIALACAAVMAVGASCNKKAAATPGVTAKRYVEHIVNDDYESFVKAISFTQPVSKARSAEVEKVHAAALRAIQHPKTVERGGIKEVKVVSEKMSPDNKTCEVVLANHYNNGVVSTMEMRMAKEDGEWKVRETPGKEIWKATTSEGDTEVVKVRTGGEREFVKDKVRDMGEKQFVKDIHRAGGDVEVVKVLEDGSRHKEVIKSAVNEAQHNAGQALENGATGAMNAAKGTLEAGKSAVKSAESAVKSAQSAVKSAEGAAKGSLEAGKSAVKSAENAVEAGKSAVKSAEKVLPKR